MSRRAQEAQELAEKQGPKIPRKAGEELNVVPDTAFSAASQMDDILEFK